MEADDLQCHFADWHGIAGRLFLDRMVVELRNEKVKTPERIYVEMKSKCQDRKIGMEAIKLYPMTEMCSNGVD